MSLALLKQRLAEILDVDRPSSPGLATGIAALDGGLAAGGIPRGRLTEVRGALGSGKTTLVRRVAERAVGAGVQVAYVDATRTLAPRDWAHLAREEGGEGLWVVRPADPGRGAWCADVLLRSGAFGLVVLDGGPPLPRGVAVRLTRLARESDAALVVVGEERAGEWGRGGGGGGALVGGALRLRVEARPGPAGEEDGRGAGGGGDGVGRRRGGGEERRHAHWRPRQQQRQQRQWSERHRGDRRFVVAIEKGGIHQTVEVGCAIAVARRLCAHPEVPDRRGVGRGGGAGGAGERRGARDGGRHAAGAADAPPGSRSRGA